MDAVARHLSGAALGEYVSSGNAAAVPVPGTPEALLTIDPRQGSMRIEVSWDGVQPPAIPHYLHLSTAVVYRDGRNWSVLSVNGTDYFQQAYPLFCSVLDRVQLEGESFATAVPDALQTYHDLLAAAAGMSPDQEVGLYGELLVLNHLVGRIGPDGALQAWRGGDIREEHDFGLPSYDLEVKTTLSEGRRHRISSLSQLTATLDRPLWLVSVQLTPAGLGDGRRLPDLVRTVRAALPAALAGAFEQRLTAAEFRPGQAPETFRLLRPRARAACFKVDDDFPRLTRAMLQDAGADLDRMDEVRYAVQLDNLTPSADPPTLLTDILDEAGTR